MARLEIFIVLVCVFTSGSIGERIVRDATPESPKESTESEDSLKILLKAFEKQTGEVQKTLQVSLILIFFKIQSCYYSSPLLLTDMRLPKYSLKKLQLT